MSKNPKTVLITGASSGIGEAAALRLADDGHRLFLGARRTQRLQALAGRIEAAGGTASFRRLDVTDAADVQQFVADATDTYGGVDVIINNAGVMPLSALAENKVDEWNRMIDVNIRGVLHGVSAALPVMRAQGSGHIINLASIGAHEVEPTAAVYCATKFAVWAISQGLRKEQSGDIRVSVISPGVTESELAESISDVQARDAMREYRALALPASAIADAIAFAIGQPPRSTSTRSSSGRPPAPINSWFVGFAGRQSSDRLSAPARHAWWVTDRSLTMTVVSPNRRAVAPMGQNLIGPRSRERVLAEGFRQGPRHALESL